jgi:hypothetical protein
MSFLGDTGYRDYVENAASFNTRLLVERRMRLPFLDAQTGDMWFLILIIFLPQVLLAIFVSR